MQSDLRRNSRDRATMHRAGLAMKEPAGKAPQKTAATSLKSGRSVPAHRGENFRISGSCGRGSHGFARAIALTADQQRLSTVILCREKPHTNRTQKLSFLSSVSFVSFVESASC